jgi:hypothetical protein
VERGHLSKFRGRSVFDGSKKEKNEASVGVKAKKSSHDDRAKN